MESFVFAASNDIEARYLNSLVTFADKAGDFYEVVLANKKELEILFSLLGMNLPEESMLTDSEDFFSVLDCSSFSLPELGADEFDVFYDKWIDKTGRKSDMDEYGQLVFIQGQAAKWNKNSQRFVLRTKP